ncbi:hypothetical protein NC653_040520 [Populus alba x Populus x berolinensis]|uniref:Peptidase M24 C-terminal domain-containing protein n=1 Tax=Populus alba x Populus x berolinensis TaxID=444605 RepID=A0AAD6L6D1_9ROSI|nr:hypothetical protein NC653_040520 [Populus alba x Populus x berolinensis]
MIDFTLLASYHGRCRDILAPYLDESEMAWLNKATEPIGVRFLFLVDKDPLKK